MVVFNAEIAGHCFLVLFSSTDIDIGNILHDSGAMAAGIKQVKYSGKFVSQSFEILKINENSYKLMYTKKYLFL